MARKVFREHFLVGGAKLLDRPPPGPADAASVSVQAFDAGVKHSTRERKNHPSWSYSSPSKSQLNERVNTTAVAHRQFRRAPAAFATQALTCARSVNSTVLPFGSWTCGTASPFS